MGIPFQKKTWTNWVDDIDEDEMNRIEDGIEQSYDISLIAVSDTAPAECETGDKYYNTEDNLIYTAIDIDEWDDQGEEPIPGIQYIVYATKTAYSYDETNQLLTIIGSSEALYIDGVKTIWYEEEEENEES